MKVQNRTKRHHYVPNFYLKHFLDPNEQIWVYDKRAADIAAAARADVSDNVAIQGNIYSVAKDDGTYDDRLDEWLQGVEATAAPLHIKLKNGEMLEGQEKADYAVFLSSLAIRTPAMLNTVAEMQGARMQRRTDRALKDEQSFEREIEEFKKSRFCKNPDGVDARALAEFMRDKSRYTLRIHQQLGLSAFSFLDKLTEKFFDMSWTIYRSQGLRLVTSDNPVVHTIIGSAPTREQESRPVELVTLPLSSSMMLELRWRKTPYGRVRDVGKDVAQFYNSMRAFNAEQYVFADANDSVVAALVHKYRNTKMRSDLVSTSESVPMAPMSVARKL